MHKILQAVCGWVIGTAVLVYVTAVTIYSGLQGEANWWPAWWLWIVAGVAAIAALLLLVITVRVDSIEDERRVKDELERNAEAEHRRTEAAERKAEALRARLKDAVDYAEEAFKADAAARAPRGDARITVPGVYTFNQMRAELQLDMTYKVKWTTNRALVGTLKPGKKGGFDAHHVDHGFVGWAKDVEEGVLKIWEAD